MPFSLLSEVPDLEPPVVVAALVGAGHFEDDGAIVLGRGARIRLVGRDDASGVEEIRYRWGEGRWLVWSGRDLALSEGAAEDRLEVEATDSLGRKAVVWSTRVLRNASAPSAPIVHVPRFAT